MQIIIGDITIEAGTLKELTRLAKKEEQRQRVERKLKEGQEDTAYHDAWAQFGKISYFLTTDHKFWFRELEFSGHCQTGSEENCTLYLHTRAGNGVFMLNRRFFVPTVLIEDPAGTQQAIRVRNQDGKISWSAIGVCQRGEDGVVKLLSFPDTYAKQLEDAYLADTAKRAA